MNAMNRILKFFAELRVGGHVKNIPMRQVFNPGKEE
jgi:hypothetical protein